MILNSLKKTIEVIKKNKSKLLLIFLLQTIFLIALSIISYNTLVPAMEYAKNALDYYDTINMTENSATFGYLGENPLIIYESYKGMIYYLKWMFWLSIFSFILINSLIWVLSDNLINKKNLKQFLNYILNFIILTSAFILLVDILVFEKLKSSLVGLEYDALPLVGNSVLFFILIYFLLTGFSLIDKRKIKDIFKLTFKIGIFKFHYIIIIYLINLLIILLVSSLVYLTIESAMFLLSIAVVLLVFSIIFTRIFLITSINELTNELTKKN